MAIQFDFILHNLHIFFITEGISVIRGLLDWVEKVIGGRGGK